MSGAAQQLREAAAQRILVKDGAYGTQIQARKLREADYAGSLGLSRDQKGNNDLLNLTKPDLIREAGDQASEADGKKRWVAGALGPTNKTLSLSPDVNDPGYREVDFDLVSDVYVEQIEALVEGGVDFVLIETVFDTLNAKAAIHAARRVDPALPIMVSMTITDLSGRNLSGHSIESFWASVRHARPLTIGLNCSFGAAQLRAHIAALSGIADTLIMAYPNAGLPNDLGEYDEAAADTARQVREWCEQGIVNIVGGCCGTTPEHIRAIAETVKGFAPRQIPQVERRTRLAGIEPMVLAA